MKERMKSESGNLFATMTDDNIKSIYPDYDMWVNDGIIPSRSVLSEIRDRYRTMYSHGYSHIMELQYLRECAKRFSQK